MKGIIVSIALLPTMVFAIGISNNSADVKLNPKTGDISSVVLKNMNVLSGANELWTFENSSGKTFTASSEKNRIQKVEKSKGGISLTLKNPMLNKKNISIAEKYFWENDILIKRIELTNNSKTDWLLKAISKTHIAGKVKRNGLYYVPYGSFCVAANKIKQPTKIKNQIYSGIKNQMISVYDTSDDILACSFIYRVNERFTTPFSGWCVPSYLSGGWEFASCLYFIKSGETVSYDIAYYIVKGSPSKLIRRWIKLDDIQKIRSEVWKNITVPDWLKKVALVGFVYNPIQIDAAHFIPNAKPLADKLPGNWMVMQWGSSHRSFNIKNYLKGYGQPHPPQCEDIRWALRDLPKIRKAMPNVKIGNYRYYWSLDDGSPECVMHPEWRLIARNGKPVYAGTVHRYARNPLIPQAVESCVFTTREWYTYVPVDFHYVDGTDGAYPAWVGWKRKVTPQWYDWHKLFVRVYRLIHSGIITPSVLYCNGAPISCGDAGFVEIGGNNKNIWQSAKGWQGLADRCETGKLWGPPQGFMSLLFWDSRTDLRYVNHILAYGLVPNLAPGGARYTGSEGLDFCLPRVPYIKAAYKIRHSQLVYPQLKPDWRADGGDIEAIMIKVGEEYRINVINHSDGTKAIKLSFKPDMIGLAGRTVRLTHLELIPPSELIKQKSDTAFKVIDKTRLSIPREDRCVITINAKPKLLNTIIISSSF